MSTMGHNSVDNGEYHYDLDQWTCPSCFKTLSSSRHPIYNENICSCADLGWCTKETTESNYRYGGQNHTSNLGGSLPCDGKIRSCKTTCAMDLDPTYRFTSHHYIRALSYLWAEPTDRIRRTYALLDNCSYGVANGSRSDKERERRQKLYGQEGPLTAEQLAKQLRKQRFRTQSDEVSFSKDDAYRRLIYINDLDASSINLAYHLLSPADRTPVPWFDAQCIDHSDNLQAREARYRSCVDSRSSNLPHSYSHAWAATLQHSLSTYQKQAIFYSALKPPKSTGVPSNCDSRVEKNSEWILYCEEYKTWLDQPSGCLWVCGSTGSGKTTVMAAMRRHLEAYSDTGEFLASYFSDADVKELNPSIAILRNIIIELLCQEPADNPHDILQDQLKELICAGDYLSASRMRIIESKIRHTLRGDVKLYVFVDASDEYGRDKEEQEVLSELIERLIRYDPDHHIKCLVSGWSTFCEEKISGVRIDLNSHPANRKCLEQYIRDALQDRIFLREAHDAEILAEMASTKPGGMFLWARLALQDVRLSIESRTDSASLDEIILFLDKMDLSILYERMLGRIKDCDKDAALSMLRWVTYVVRPLHAQELIGALSAETGIEIDEANIVESCGGLLSINRNRIVRLVHPSVRGFLQTRMKQNWNEVSDKANEVIAHTCLKALSSGKLRQSLDLLPQSSRGSLDLGEPKDKLPSFENYAQSHWVFHYRFAEATSRFLAGFLHSLFESSFRKIPSYDVEGKATPATLDSVNTGLLIGARFGFSKLAKLELEMGANVDVVSGLEGLTPLIWASMAGHADIIELLLQYDANPEFRTRYGNNALMYAIANGYHEIVKILLGQEAQSMDLDEHQGAPNAIEELSWNVSYASACDTCGALETVYELKPISHGSHSSIADASSEFSPIVARGEIIPEAEVEMAIFEPVYTILNWPRGGIIRKTLTVAASRGIEDVKKLFDAVGNDVGALVQNMPLSALTSELTI